MTWFKMLHPEDLTSPNNLKVDVIQPKETFHHSSKHYLSKDKTVDCFKTVDFPFLFYNFYTDTYRFLHLRQATDIICY